MLKIRSDIVHSIRAAQQRYDLYGFLQSAIELEHATIPAYLQALYSIKHGRNTVIATLIRSIIVEEMLHMTIAANLLNALDGKPMINKPDFIPVYPGPLPMNIHEGLQVGLAPLSKLLLENVFMEIEMPEEPQHFPERLQAFATAGYATIGLFYAAIAEKLKELGDDAFKGNPARQIVNSTWFADGELFPIRDVASAVRGIDVIVRQGEGTSRDPLDGDGQPAHYYRFAEIFYGKHLMPDPMAKEKYSYSGAPIPYDQSGIWDMVTNPKVRNYKAGSTAWVYANRFNGIYTNLLNSLHLTFNGQPSHLSQAIGGMYELRLAGEALIEIRDDVTGRQAAPTFEYAPNAA